MRRYALAALACVALFTMTACGKPSHASGPGGSPSDDGGFGLAPDGSRSGLANGSPNPDNNGNAADSGQNDGQGNGQNGNQNNGQNGSQSPGTKGSGSPYTGPVIVTFRLSQNPECPKGTNLDPVPGVDAIVEWKVTNADTVTLSVDGPGLYDTYGLTGSQRLGFGCGGPPNSMAHHSYTLTATRNGVKATKTITASAKVYEIGILTPPSTR